MITSSIAIGEEDSFDLIGPLKVRICDDDEEYPIALEGETKGGHGVSISLTKNDAYQIYLDIDNSPVNF
jgi:hypothetical protein